MERRIYWNECRILNELIQCDSAANDLAHRFTAADVILQLNEKLWYPTK